MERMLLLRALVHTALTTPRTDFDYSLVSETIMLSVNIVSLLLALCGHSLSPASGLRRYSRDLAWPEPHDNAGHALT